MSENCSGGNPIVDFASGGFGKRLDHFEHAVPAPRAKVDGEHVRMPRKRPQRGQMPQGQIHDVDVIADARPIGRGIIRAIDGKLRQNACRNLDDIT